MKKEKAIPYIVKGLISLGIALAGAYYISKMPKAEPKYTPVEVKSGKYTLVDVNSDKKVDLIKVNGTNKYVNENKRDFIQSEIPDYRFLGFEHLKSITPEIQAVADSVFSGYLNEKNIEKILEKTK